MGNSVTQPFVTENVIYHLKTLPEEFSVYLTCSICPETKTNKFTSLHDFCKEPKIALVR